MVGDGKEGKGVKGKEMLGLDLFDKGQELGVGG